MITFRQVSITTPSPPPPPPPDPPPPPTPPTPGVGFSSVAQGGGKETIEIFISPGFFFFFPFLLLLFHLLLLLLLLFLYYDYYYYYFYSSFVGGGLQRGSTWRPVGLSRDKSSETNQQMKNKREREMDREKKKFKFKSIEHREIENQPLNSSCVSLVYYRWLRGFIHGTIDLALILLDCVMDASSGDLFFKWHWIITGLLKHWAGSVEVAVAVTVRTAVIGRAVDGTVTLSTFQCEW